MAHLVRYPRLVLHGALYPGMGKTKTVQMLKSWEKLAAVAIGKLRCLENAEAYLV